MTQWMPIKLRMFFAYWPHLTRWWSEVGKQDADEQMCCNGYMCGCYGATYGDMWEHLLRPAMPLPPAPEGE